MAPRKHQSKSVANTLKTRINKDNGVDVDALLKSIYYDVSNANAFSGKRNVYKAAKKLYPKLTLRDVSNWFEKQLTYTLHKPVRYNFQRNKTIVLSIDDQFQADLCDMTSLAKDNDNHKFLLTCIDCFSKYAWVEPLHRKSSDNIVRAFERIFAKDKRVPKRLQTDKGTEFLNKPVQQFLKKHNVHFFTTETEMKASIVERFNRTLKTRMYKYFTAKNTLRYIDVLQDLVNAYNNTSHRSIGMVPANVTKRHELEIRQRLYGVKNIKHSKKYKYNVDDEVRISKARRTFKKGYLPQWTEEHFHIHSRKFYAEPLYELRDLSGEVLQGTFYEKELQKVRPLAEYRVEKVIRKKKQGNKVFYLVQWKGYSDKFNTWVSENDLHAL